MHHGSQTSLAVSSWLHLHVPTCIILLRAYLLIKVTSSIHLNEHVDSERNYACAKLQEQQCADCNKQAPDAH